MTWTARRSACRRPVGVADGAHSRDSARRLRESLTRYLSCRGAFLIVGMSAGKDAIGLAEELAPVASGVITVRADHPRAMPPQEAARVSPGRGYRRGRTGGVGRRRWG